MTEREIQEQRRRKWRVAGNPVRTLEDAREFIESVGLCLLYPVKPPVLAPTFVGAYVGSESGLPTLRQAFADVRAREASELMVRLLRERAAYEAHLFGDSFLVAASVFPYYYAVAGDRNPRQVPKQGGHAETYSPLAVDVLEMIRNKGPISKKRLQEKLSGDLSEAALDRGLVELWTHLRITRVDCTGEGALWDVLYRWSPEAVKEGIQLSGGEALSALLSKYLECVIAAEPQEVEDFFSNLAPRSKVKEAINALQAGRELNFLHVGNRTLLHVTPPRLAAGGTRARGEGPGPSSASSEPQPTSSTRARQEGP